MSCDLFDRMKSLIKSSEAKNAENLDLLESDILDILNMADDLLDDECSEINVDFAWSTVRIAEHVKKGRAL